MVLPLSLVVAALAMLAPFSIDTYLPSFPAIAAEFDASVVQMQQTLSLYLYAFAISTLIYGPLSDRFGRRGVVMVALLIYATSSVAAVMAQSIEQLITARVLQGLSASAGLVVGRAMVRDLYHGHQAQRVMAMVMMLFAIAPALAPVVGGLLESWLGWRSVFWFLALLGGVMVLMLGFGTRETLPLDARHSIHPVKVGRLYLSALGNLRFMGLVVSFALMFGGFFIYIAGAPSVIFDHLKLGADQFWVLFVPLVSGMVVGSLLSRTVAGRLSPYRTVLIGFLVMVAAGVLNVAQAYWLVPTPFAVIAPLTIYTFGVALVMPNITLMTLDCFPQNRGMASALQGFVQMSFGAVVAGSLVPLLAHAVSTLALGMLILCGVAMVVWLAVEWLAPEPESTPVAEPAGQALP